MRYPSFFVILAALHTLLAACTAATQTGAPMLSVSDATSAARKETTLPAPIAPATDAAEALRRLLKLIDSLHEPEDLTPERVTQVSGVLLTTRPSRPNDFDGFQQLTENWEYYYSMWLNEYKWTVMDFAFNKGLKDRPPMTQVCSLDMNQFHASLLEMGFSQTGNTRASTLQNQYQRGMVFINIAHVGESRENISHSCIEKIQVRFLPVP